MTRLTCSLGGTILLLGSTWLLKQDDASPAEPPSKTTAFSRSNASDAALLQGAASEDACIRMKLRDGTQAETPLSAPGAVTQGRVDDRSDRPPASSSTPLVLLGKLLENDGYIRVKLDRLRSGYLAVTAMVNGKPLYLAIDTAAPNTHLDPKRTEHLKLPWELFQFTDRPDDPPPAEWERMCRVDSIEFGGFRRVRIRVGGHDHAEINHRMEFYKDRPLDGVIGADVLESGLAILDYKTYDLYLIQRPGGNTNSP